MRQLSVLMALMCAVLLAVNSNYAQDKKEEGKTVVLKGSITCAKCDLGVSKSCATVIVVKDKDKKDDVYYIDKASNKKYHGDTCQAAKNGTIEGVVSDEGKKKVVTVKKLNYE